MTPYTVKTTSLPLSGGTTAGGGTFAPLSNATVTAKAATGYAFTGWTENGVDVSPLVSLTLQVNANRSLVANFTPTAKFTVTTSSNPSIGGTSEGDGSFFLDTVGQVLATPATAYVFTNWTNEKGTVISTAMSYKWIVDSNRSFTANFANAPSFTVRTSPDPSVGGTVAGGNGTYLVRTVLRRTATPATGYSFRYWTVDGTAIVLEQSFEIQVTANQTFVANFVPIVPSAVPRPIL